MPSAWDSRGNDAMSTSRLTQRIRQANAQGRKALIPFLPAGFPDKERFWRELEELDRSGADIIEIGIPFSDPVADGPVVEQASLDCLAQGVCLSWVLGELGKRRSGLQAEIVLMGYLNPFLQYGPEQLAKDAAEAGVAGLIVPDLPLEEAAVLKEPLAAQGLDLIHLVGLNTSPERLALYARVATGFIYFVSVLGTTGARAMLPEEVGGRLSQAREAFNVPVALGFGIKSPDQLKELGGSLDAVVFGSALISHIRDGGSSASFMSSWRQ